MLSQNLQYVFIQFSWKKLIFFLYVIEHYVYHKVFNWVFSYATKDGRTLKLFCPISKCEQWGKIAKSFSKLLFFFICSFFEFQTIVMMNQYI